MNELDSPHRPTAMPCNECPAGIMHLRYITYFTWLGEELITVPNFPAWVCDICGKREFDGHAITRLSMILSPDAGQPNRRITPKPQPDRHKRNLPPPMLDQ